MSLGITPSPEMEKEELKVIDTFIKTYVKKLQEYESFNHSKAKEVTKLLKENLEPFERKDTKKLLNYGEPLTAQQKRDLEINTRLFDDPKTEQFYSDLLINFKKLGGKLITLGTDSHIAKRDWLSIHRARTLIKKAGFHELATFSGMKIDKNKKSIKE